MENEGAVKPKNKLLTNTFIVALGAIICCALWGSATPFIKTGYELLEVSGVPSIMLFAGMRFTLAGILTIIIFSIGNRKFLYPKKTNWDKVLLISVFQTILQYLFFYVGLANTTGVKGTIASGTSCFFSMLFASLIFKQEKLTVKKIVACVLGIAGIIIVNLDGLDFNMNFLGDGFVLFSAMANAISASLMKRCSKYETPVVLSGYQFVVGGIVMIIIGLVSGGRISLGSAKGIGVLVYLAFLSAIAYSLWGILLKYNDVSKVVIFTFTTPLFGVILSNLMLKESSKVPPLNLVLTLVLICSGIFLVNFNFKKKTNEENTVKEDGK